MVLFKENLEQLILLTSSKSQPLLKNPLKTQKKLRELEIKCSNAIYICVSWYSKIYWFSVKKCWCQQNSSDVSRDLYILWIFFGHGMIVQGITIVGCVRHILRRGAFLFPPILEQPRKKVHHQ